MISLKNYELLWDSVSDRVRKGIFLPTGFKLDGDFSGTDSERLFNENLVVQPADWYYRNNPIEYKLNTHGYRTTEFNTIDWANSVVIFGCSNVFGTGLREEDTLANQLASLIKIPVINMGVSASSIEYSIFNSMILSAYYPTPKAVIQIYSAIDRTTYYTKKNVMHHGAWNDKSVDYFEHWSMDSTHARVHALMFQLMSKKLWADKTKYYEASFFQDTARTLCVPTIELFDFARDLKHPGRRTVHLVAEQIAKIISL